MSAAQRSRVNAIALSELLLGLQDACHTMHELADMSGLAIQTVRTYCGVLHRKKLIHIADWREDNHGGRTLRVFAFGSGNDMPKPPRMSQIECCRRWREKQKQKKLLQRMVGPT